MRVRVRVRVRLRLRSHALDRVTHCDRNAFALPHTATRGERGGERGGHLVDHSVAEASAIVGHEERLPAVRLEGLVEGIPLVGGGGVRKGSRRVQNPATVRVQCSDWREGSRAA